MPDKLEGMVWGVERKEGGAEEAVGGGMGEEGGEEAVVEGGGFV